MLVSGEGRTIECCRTVSFVRMMELDEGRSIRKERISAKYGVSGARREGQGGRTRGFMPGWHLGDEDGRHWFGCRSGRMEGTIPVDRRVDELLLQWGRVSLVKRGGDVLLRRGLERLVVE
jgi:hypothetical protein